MHRIQKCFNLKIYLTEQATKELRGLSRQDGDAFGRLIDKLRMGFWDNGTRVKKLRGVGGHRCILEARLDDSRRMLFTLMPDPAALTPEVALIVLHPIVRHDDVRRRATVWLRDSMVLDEIVGDRGRVPETVDELVDAYRSEWPEQHLFHQELGLAKKFEATEEMFVRYMMSLEEQDEEIDFRLALHPEQLALLKKPLPLLMAGTAGSGKTTVLLHKLLINPHVKKLYITYSQELCDETRHMFERQIAHDDHEEEQRANTRFATFKDFLDKEKPDSLTQILTRDLFLIQYRRYAQGKQLERRFPALMVWEEIRGVWKGGAFPTQGETMSEEVYLALSPQQAPNFADRRKEAYRIFEWYQKQFLEEHQMVDEQDLLRQALARPVESFDLVLCDEIQDLTMLHLAYLFALAGHRPDALMLAGDDHQIVHHSGFRWSRVKDAFYGRLGARIGNIECLSHNYRNVGSIANLASEINKLQREYTEFTYHNVVSDTFVDGEKPLALDSVPEADLQASMVEAGPREAVLVRTEEERERLQHVMKTRFGKTPLVFTVPQAKGLEFDKVYIWGFFASGSEEEKRWDSILRHMKSKRKSAFKGDWATQRFLHYELSLLYVAVTRAMKSCVIYDGPALGSFWNMENLRQTIQVETALPVSAGELIRSYRDEDWLEQGNTLLKKKLYAQAAECFSRVLSREEGARGYQLCLAALMRHEGKWEEAAAAYEKLEEYDEAVSCYEEGGLYVQMANLCKKMMFLQRDQKQKWQRKRNEAKIKALDQDGRWYGSAIYCLQNHWYLEAYNRFLRHWELDPSDRIRTARSLEQTRVEGLAFYRSRGLDREADKLEALHQQYYILRAN